MCSREPTVRSPFDLNLFFSDTYDCVVVSGGMGEGHIPCRAVPEMIRIAKPGKVLTLV